MYSDMFVKNFYYNIHIANIFGLNCAVYLSALLTEWDDFITNPSSSYMTVDRKKVQGLTTLTPTQQKDEQKKLVSASILVEKDVDNVTISSDTLVSLFNKNEEELKIIKNNSSNYSKVSQQQDKKTIYANSIKRFITHKTDQLDSLMCNWIDSVVEKFGYMNKAQLQQFEEDLEKYSHSDFIIQEELLKICIRNSYRDLHWAVERYEEENKTRVTADPVQKTVTVARGVIFE